MRRESITDKLNRVYINIIKEDPDMESSEQGKPSPKTSEKTIANFNRMLNSIKDEVVEVIENYHDEASRNFPNFPVVDINLLDMHMEDSEGYTMLNPICRENKDLENIRWNWLLRVGKETIGKDFIDFSNLTPADNQYLKTEYTYFEDGDDDESIIQKWRIFTNDKNLLFDSKTGEIANPDRYEYLGEGMIKDKETGEEYDGKDLY